MNKQPVIIGLTGNIATGKSTVLQMASEKGAFVIDADVVVHTLLAENQAVLQQIRTQFGEDIFAEDGALIRPALGRIVFSSPEKLAQLEAILHPAVRIAVKDAIAKTDASIVLIEAIKLLEGELKALCDQIWVTHCDAELQQKRLMEARAYSAEDAIRRIEAQNPQSDKIAQADVLFNTNGTLFDTITHFEHVWKTVGKPQA